MGQACVFFISQIKFGDCGFDVFIKRCWLLKGSQTGLDIEQWQQHSRAYTLRAAFHLFLALSDQLVAGQRLATDFIHWGQEVACRVVLCVG